MDSGPLGRYWEVYEDNRQDVEHVQPDEMGDYIDNVRRNGYDVLINTYESWENE